MRGILVDINIQGHVRALIAFLESDAWREIWRSLKLPLYTFPDIGLPANTSDAVVWQICQEQGFILLTGNRNADGPDSLEVTLRRQNTSASLPVLTIGNTERVMKSKQYAESGQATARIPSGHRKVSRHWSSLSSMNVNLLAQR